MAFPRNNPDAVFQLANLFAGRDDVPLHSHTGTELVFVTEGSCVIEVAGLRLAASAGTLLVLPPREPQVMRTLEWTRTTYVIFKTPQNAWDHSARVLAVGVDSLLRRWMDDLAALHRSHSDSSPDVMDRLLGVVLEEINHHEHRRRSAAGLHPAVVRASGLIGQTFAAPFDIQKIADAAGSSASHLTALFRQQLGSSPLKYQRDLRIRYARKLLADPYLNVKQVARACGYDDTSYFVRVFRKQVGQSPGQWRLRRHANKSER